LCKEIGDYGLWIGDVAGLKAQNFQFTTKNFRSTKVQILTKAAIFANVQIAVAV
jgi:hypothetical protein